MKKLLFVIHSLGFGGAERSLVNLLHELPKEEYEVDVLLFQRKGGLLEQLPSWVRVLETPKPLEQLFGSVKKAGRFLPTKVLGTACGKLMRRTRKACRAYRWKAFYRKKVEMLPGHYDTAVAYVGTEVLYYVADRVSADRKLVWIHNDYRTAKYSKTDDMPYLEKMDAIVSVSQECVNVLKDEFPMYRDRIFCVENITSSAAIQKRAEEFYPEEYRDCACNILSVGRLSVQKGFDLAIDAAIRMKEKGIGFRWFVIGDGDQREKLEAQIQESGAGDCFKLLGTRSNPYPYIKNCTLFVQPSRFEGKSVVLDETKILAVPIVATDYPTVADQIEADREGLIVPMNPQGLAEGISDLLLNIEKRGYISDFLAAREYGNREEVAKYLQLLEG